VYAQEIKMTTSTDTFINKRIGRYEIRERIGAGGMARVFKVWDTNLERVVAVKILHDHLTQDPTFKERFEREAKLVAGLNHPNIVQIYDYDVVDFNGQMLSYMVMPFIPGKTLKEVLEDLAAHSERMSYDQIRAVMLDVSSALSYAHDRDMVHRDVKPGNIMFDEHGKAILTDFGIARLKMGAQLTQEGATIGTPTYLSPEQAVGNTVDARSDLYALGVILYEMLAGTPPYVDENSVSIILKHLNAPIPAISEVMSVNDPELDALIYKALAKNRDDRYQTAHEFADDLSRVLGKSPQSSAKSAQVTPKLEIAHTQPITPPISRTGQVVTTLTPPASSRSPLTVLAFVIAVLSLLIALSLIFIQRLQPAEEPHVASMTGNKDVYFLSTFSSDDMTTSGWPQSTEGSILRQITTDGFYSFQNQLRNTAATTIYNPEYVYQDATITTEGTLQQNSPPDSGYGIVFRYKDDLNYNVFAVDGRGRFSIWSLVDGTWSELRGASENWTHNDFVKPLGQKNQLTVTFVRDHLLGSVNQQTVADVHVDSATIHLGAVGLYLGTTDTGGANILVDTYEVSGSIPSMTGEQP
jgi:serine/threonine protein kinase